MIEVTELYKAFGSQPVFRGISIQLKRSEITFVLGRSGVGKSVLLKHIVGLMTPDSGSILVEGDEIVGMDEVQLTRIRKKCGMVFQFPALLDSLTVFDNVAFGIRAHSLVESEEEVRDRVGKCLNQVQLPEHILERYPPELSFGLQKRVAIARTLAIQPDYLLFDEPTTSMDPTTTRSINCLILDLKRALGVAAVVVSHDVESAMAIGDRLIVLDDGLVVFNGTKQRFQDDPHPICKGFIEEGFTNA